MIDGNCRPAPAAENPRSADHRCLYLRTPALSGHPRPPPGAIIRVSPRSCLSSLARPAVSRHNAYMFNSSVRKKAMHRFQHKNTTNPGLGAREGDSR